MRKLCLLLALMPVSHAEAQNENDPERSKCDFIYASADPNTKIVGYVDQTNSFGSWDFCRMVLNGGLESNQYHTSTNRDVCATARIGYQLGESAGVSLQWDLYTGAMKITAIELFLPRRPWCIPRERASVD